MSKYVLHRETVVFLYAGDMKRLLETCDPDFELVPVGKNGCKVYMLNERDRSFIVSQEQYMMDGLDCPPYNCIASVISKRKQRLKRYMDKFVKTLGIDACEAPEMLKIELNRQISEII